MERHIQLKTANLTATAAATAIAAGTRQCQQGPLTIEGFGTWLLHVLAILVVQLLPGL